MSRKLYFLFADTETAEKVVQDLLLARIEEKHMHFLGKRGTDMKNLHEATPAQKTGLLRGIYIGLFSGAITGLLAGLYIYFSPGTLGMQAPPYVIFICAFVGAIVGAWISGPLIGGSTPNAKLAAFQESLQQGDILLIIDVHAKRAEDVRKIIKEHCQNAEAGLDSATSPA
jgi:hypothetical protein